VPPVDKHLNPTDPRHRPGRLAFWMRALGRANLPEEIRVADVPYRHVRTVKHDFVAATGFYKSENGTTVVLKLGRTAPLFGLPAAFVGRWSCGRELRFYRKLADLPNIPAVLGTIGRTGFVHAFVPGRPLSADRPVPNKFFDQLLALLGQLHARGMAYVDTNKPENILLGDDGRPYLIDFQISADARTFGGAWSPIARWLVRRLQHEDRYHVLKHKRRLRPDELTPAERDAAERKSWLIRLHRAVFKPYFLVRRRIMTKWRSDGTLLPEGSK
jgi:hypothetical protein